MDTHTDTHTHKYTHRQKSSMMQRKQASRPTKACLAATRRSVPSCTDGRMMMGDAWTYYMYSHKAMYLWKFCKANRIFVFILTSHFRSPFNKYSVNNSKNLQILNFQDFESFPIFFLFFEVCTKEIFIWFFEFCNSSVVKGKLQIKI